MTAPAHDPKRRAMPPLFHIVSRQVDRTAGRAINVNDFEDTRDVTGIVFGDPVPERSALWKKRNGVKA